MREPGLERAFSSPTVVERVAFELGLDTATVSRWESVPPRHLDLVERVSGVARRALRPDLPPEVELLHELTREEFYKWVMAKPKGRYERVDGRVHRMPAERYVHAVLKQAVLRALESSINERRLPCQAIPDGLTVSIGPHTDYEPDATVNCGEPPEPDAITVPNPVVVVEIESPSTRSKDNGRKLVDYFRLDSVQHYLIVASDERLVTHHRRTSDTVTARFVRDDVIELDLPGIAITLADIYRD